MVKNIIDLNGKFPDQIEIPTIIKSKDTGDLYNYNYFQQDERPLLGMKNVLIKKNVLGSNNYSIMLDLKKDHNIIDNLNMVQRKFLPGLVLKRPFCNIPENSTKAFVNVKTHDKTKIYDVELCRLDTIPDLTNYKKVNLLLEFKGYCSNNNNNNYPQFVIKNMSIICDHDDDDDDEELLKFFLDD